MEARASSPAQNSHVYSICVNRKYDYRRKLPHLQPDRKLFFVTFGTHKRWILPPVARDIVLESCLYAHSKRFLLHAVVVMPDHVHLVFMPLSDSAGSFSIPEIMQAIKSFSAHRINRFSNGGERSGRMNRLIVPCGKNRTATRRFNTSAKIQPVRV
jgi:REP element-mobilizing transposase RayT